MKKYILTLSLMLSLVFAMAQSITLTFTAEDQYGNYHEFETVKIENLTRDWQHYLTYPNTSFELQVTDGIGEMDEPGDGLSVVGSNPFRGTAHAELQLTEDGPVEVKALQLDGKLVARYEGTLPTGTHRITFNAAASQMYLLVATTAQGCFATKLMNVGNGSGSNGIDVNMVSKAADKKYTKSREMGYFMPGDEMRYTAFNSDEVSNALTQHQYESEEIVLIFVVTPPVELPQVVTNEVTDIASTSAVGNGEVVSDGGATVTERGVCWSTEQNPGIGSTHASNGMGEGSFNVDITNLLPNTTYYVRAYATNSMGTSYGEQKTFTTSASMPVVVTNNVTSIASTSAMGNGNVVSDGGATVTERGVCWSTVQNPTISGTHAANGTGVGSFSVNMADLLPSTTYYVRAYATNSKGTCYGEQKTFTTLKHSELTMKLFSVSSVRQVNFSKGNLQYQASTDTWRFAESQLECIGSDNANISSTYSGWIDLFGWGTGHNPTNASTDNSDYSSFSDWGSKPISNGGNQANQWRILTNDEWDYLISTRTTTSGIRYAKATVNETAGLIILPDDWNANYYNLKGANTSNADFTTNSITLDDWTCKFEANGAVFLPAAGYRDGTSVDDVCTYGGYWSSAYNYYYAFSYNLVFSLSGLYIGVYNRYRGQSVRLVAIALPNVTITHLHDISYTTATCVGSVVDDGSASVTARGVCWSTNENPTISDSHTTDGTGNGTFTSKLTGLTDGTTYYVRAYATNRTGTAYSEQRTFTTVAITTPVVTTSSVSNISYTTATCGGSVVDEGGANVTARGVCWSTSENPTIDDSHTTAGVGTGTFTNNITGLIPNVTYYLRAYATNSRGTSYGEQMTFKTYKEAPTGGISAFYSVSATRKVHFSQGNLQYQASTDTWRFAESQLEYIGSDNSNISSTYSGWIDLFGWGTGDNPTNTSTNIFGDNGGDYGNFTDWGVNPISNGGNIANQWRTLTNDEWSFLLFSRTTSSGIRYARATVNGVDGVIILPDNWTTSYYPLSYNNSYNSNTITLANWTSKLEAHGAVFIPAAGYRSGTSVGGAGTHGGYCWSSMPDGSGSAYSLWIIPVVMNPRDRCAGISVRLVADVE